MYNKTIIYDVWSDSFGTPTIERKRCNAIEKRLNDNGLNVYVHRHTIFGIKCYVVTGKPDGCETFFSNDLERILNIPDEWINLSKAEKPQEYYILEDEFNRKYCNDDGEIDFDDWCITGKSAREVEKRLKKKGICCSVGSTNVGGMQFYTIELPQDESIAYYKIAKLLNIDSVDVGVALHYNMYFIRSE